MAERRLKCGINLFFLEDKSRIISRPLEELHFRTSRNHQRLREIIGNHNQKVGGVQALMTSQGTGPTQRKRCGLRLSK